MTDALETDVVIVGAGIAGLWLNQRLRNLGFGTIVFEKAALGGIQSIGSQGIIHGGAKYTLHGALSSAANAISAMPQRWRASLNGTGDIDLRGTRILSNQHYMWSRDRLMSKLTTFFASKAVRSKITSEVLEERPKAFQHPDFQGNFYALNEIVVDLPSLVTRMADSTRNGIYRYDCSLPGSLALEGNQLQSVLVQNKTRKVRVKAQRYIMTAGEGNESVLHNAHLNLPAMQRRPLHMVLVKHQYQAPVYAHCVGSGSKPVATITTHYMQDGQPVWYIGGDIAETGVERDKNAQIDCTRKLLREILPWIDLGETQWSSCMIHRAEPLQQSIIRPDTAFLHQQGNIITCWPTKLALAPNLADRVVRQLNSDQVTPKYQPDYPSLSFLKRPELAVPIWEQHFK